MTDRTCGTCYWWRNAVDLPNEMGRTGECRRFPPTAIKAKGSTHAFGWYPEINEANAGCGEWKKLKNLRRFWMQL